MIPAGLIPTAETVRAATAGLKIAQLHPLGQRQARLTPPDYSDVDLDALIGRAVDDIDRHLGRAPLDAAVLTVEQADALRRAIIVQAAFVAVRGGAAELGIPVPAVVGVTIEAGRTIQFAPPQNAPRLSPRADELLGGHGLTARTLTVAP